MADERKGAYAEVEGLKKSKYKIGKDYKRIELIISLVASLVFMIIFTQNILSIDIFFLPPMAQPKSDFNQKAFIVIISIMLFFTFLFIAKKNLLSRFKPNADRIKKLKKIKQENNYSYFSFNQEMRMLLKEQVKSAIYFTLSLPFTFLNKVIYIPDDLQNNLGIEAGYLNKLEKKFFYQIVEKEDGYLRVEYLKILKDRKKIFACENDEEYKNLIKLFKSQEAFDDLFLIIEGYLTKSKLFDTALFGKNDIKEEEYEFFQSYMLRMKESLVVTEEYDPKLKRNKKIEKKQEKLEHNVAFSVNAIQFFIKNKKQEISKLIDSIIDINLYTSSRIKYATRISILLKDIHYRKKILKYLGDSNKQEKSVIIQIYQELFKEVDKYETVDEFKKAVRSNKKTEEQYNKILKYFGVHLKELLMLDFSIVLFRLVISQYMNLPAGTIVSKLDSYDTRMIIEYYKTFSTIEIEEKKNDGRSEDFNSDNYTNIFMLLWADSVDKIDIYQELYFRFNTNENIKPLTQKELTELLKEVGKEGVEKLYEEQRKDSDFSIKENKAKEYIEKLYDNDNVVNNTTDGIKTRKVDDEVL